MKNWEDFFDSENKQEYYQNLIKKVNEEYKTKIIFPPLDLVFNAFKLTKLEEVKVVIIGQDPYHNYNQAMGLSFSVNITEKLPPSLKNIYKELSTDVGVKKQHGDLSSWANQGVLLLNRVLTVEKNNPNSHRNLGWEQFTNNVISLLNKNEKPIVFILWGSNAKELEPLITNKKHLIISSAHPSPFSAHRGFFGSKPFSKTNSFLKKNNLDEINW